MSQSSICRKSAWRSSWRRLRPVFRLAGTDGRGADRRYRKTVITPTSSLMAGYFFAPGRGRARRADGQGNPVPPVAGGRLASATDERRERSSTSPSLVEKRTAFLPNI